MDTHPASPDSLPPKPTLDQLRYVVQNYPLIDNHAHNLLLPSHFDTIPFESITTEAHGRALVDTFKTLPHLRAVRQLRELYKCSEDANWEEILDQRAEWLKTNPEKLYEECFAGTHALLIDDGLAGPDRVYEYNWHDRCTKAPTKRIVRIETVAEGLMEKLLQDATEADLDDADYFTDTWLAFTEDFEKKIQEAIRDDDVAGFKTVVCYRTGLDIEPDYVRAARVVGGPFERYVARCVRRRKYRIERKALNDYLVLRTLEVLSEHLPGPDGFSKPLQLHTGLGDNDISLRESNPAYLQPLIENYPHVPFVLLHSAYPYTRQAGYLATVYKHVYLDVGEVFPMVSKDGQKTILREALELCPGSKLLYSTDGHWFPETYWLANKQFREVWLELLAEYVQEGELTPHQGINLTKDILFNNSNFLYKLRYHADFNEWVDPPKTLVWAPPVDSPAKPSPLPSRPKFLDLDHVSPTFPPPPKSPQVYDQSGIHAYEELLKSHADIKFVYVQWLDYMATIRTRILPIKEFDRMIREGGRISISQGNIGTLQNDTVTAIVNPVGQICIQPDLQSLRPTHKKDPLPAATVLSSWRDATGLPLPQCPRSNLITLLNDLQFNHGITLTCGFEIEVTFLKRNPPGSSTDPYAPLTHTHAWGTLTPEDWLHLPLLADIATSLSSMGIDLQQFHSESGPGQYEFVLAPKPALEAIDALIQARQVISQIAALYDLRATLHPQPFPGTSGAGTAAHAHVSLSPPDRELDFFVGGVLPHLPAICAFTMPETSSYSRVRDDAWTGGSWVAWGTQNRETPLRKVERGHWEVRCVDGFANMYFAVAAIAAAGIRGLMAGTPSVPVPGPGLSPPTVPLGPPLQAAPAGLDASSPPPHPPSGVPQEQSYGPNVVSPQAAYYNRTHDEGNPYPHKDCTINPSQLTPEQRLTYGIARKLPRSIDEALGALDADTELRSQLGETWVHNFMIMKRSELEMLSKMGETERMVWLVERY